MKSALLGLVSGAVAAGFILMYRFGVSTQSDRDAVVIHRLTIERDTAWTTLQTLQEAAERDAEEATQRQANADWLVANLAQERQKAQEQAVEWGRRFEQAAKRPDCAAVLEQTICPAVFKD
ncbi:hypothetical protein EO087_01805 [Dyella sp. M7H15-1]|uniref:hypothetical protein n=1 Tax=Dyella sp. M7H15-1 TaxID=2501295 RepID=UPI0010051C40|nr:hypothetical protein [Dyella sp. M7H15-1]QAU22878.1 hypothetical protein EO087_01805 [Dyella sp. M7H15-1]